MTNEEKLLIKLNTQIETLTAQVGNLTEKVEDMQKNRAIEMSEMAVIKEKVSRLERIVYGLIATVVAQAIAFITNFIK